MKGYIEYIEGVSLHRKNFVSSNGPYTYCYSDMPNEPKIPELTDIIESIEMMFCKYEAALEKDDLVTALKYKTAILKIKSVIESV